MLAPVAEDLERVDALIRARLDSDVLLVREVAVGLVRHGPVDVRKAGGNRNGRGQVRLVRRSLDTPSSIGHAR